LPEGRSICIWPAEDLNGKYRQLHIVSYKLTEKHTLHIDPNNVNTYTPVKYIYITDCPNYIIDEDTLGISFRTFHLIESIWGPHKIDCSLHMTTILNCYFFLPDFWNMYLTGVYVNNIIWTISDVIVWPKNLYRFRNFTQQISNVKAWSTDLAIPLLTMLMAS
jgi:hypothetical protein